MLEWQLAETELIHEIVATAERTATARGLGGERILRTDALWSLLVALERRIVQIVLTRALRSRLATARSAKRSWARVLLNGLEVRQMGATAHVLRVIRHRLLRDERERRR